MSVTIQATMTFGGFGTPVSVTPPPASQVYFLKSWQRSVAFVGRTS